MDKHPKWLQNLIGLSLIIFHQCFTGQLDIEVEAWYLFVHFWIKTDRYIEVISLYKWASCSQWNLQFRCRVREWNARTRLLLLRQPRRESRIRLGRQPFTTKNPTGRRIIPIFTPIWQLQPLERVHNRTNMVLSYSLKNAHKKDKCVFRSSKLWIKQKSMIFVCNFKWCYYYARRNAWYSESSMGNFYPNRQLNSLRSLLPAIACVVFPKNYKN